MNDRIDCILSPSARAALAAIGRTEDIMFSPSGRSLAIAGFFANLIAIFAVTIDVSAPRKQVTLGEVVEIEGPALRNPHGLCFLDEQTLAVANREGGVHVFAVPAFGDAAARHPRDPIRTIAGDAATPIRTPGSVASFPLDAHRLELLVCHNYANAVSRHVLDRRQGHASVGDGFLLRRGLDVPDGVCFSRDGAWIAVSNHGTQEVFVYRRTAFLGPESSPDAVLRTVICPHGVRFTADAAHLLVADAHAPFVNVYARGEGGWHGVRDPVRMTRVLEPETHLRGRTNPAEGGPKGIDLHPDANVVACTTEFQTLAFFDLAEMLSRPAPPVSRRRRYVAWRLAKAIHRRGPALYGWLPALHR